VTRTRTLALAGAVLAGCRAAPIPAAARYPAGTPFVARYVPIDGSNLRYVDAGVGSPVIFLHGFAASIYSWRKTLAPVESAGFRVIALDLRGFGSSDKPAQGYGNAEYARLVVALMDSLHLPDAVLVGHSMGGAIAAEVAIAYPERVRGLVLIDAAGAGIRAPLLLRVATWPLVLSLVSGLRGRSIAARILKSTYADPRRVLPVDVDQYYAPVAEADFGRALRGVLREFRFDALPGRLGAIQAPTLALWGAEDRWIPPRLGRALASELARVAFVTVPNAGHSVQEEAPGAVNRLLIAFLMQALPHAPANLARAPGARSRSSTGWLRKYRVAS
jgi:pimeloyl-ACP methyl ester carboxylesterase